MEPLTFVSVGGPIPLLSRYRFLAVATSTLRGFYVDRDGNRTGESFTASVNVADGTLNPQGFTDFKAIPDEAVGFVGRCTGALWMDILDPNDSQADFKTNYKRYQMVTPGAPFTCGRVSESAKPKENGGVHCYTFIPDATDELLISANATEFWGLDVYTIDATPVYVKIYDKATAPSESDTPIHRTGVPANSTSTLGSGNNKGIWEKCIPLVNGLGVRAVVGIADADDTALTTAENYVNVYWR